LPGSKPVSLPGWPLAGSCLAAWLASGPARRPGGCPLASPTITWRPGWAAVQLPGQLAGWPTDRLAAAAGWLPGLAGICILFDLFLVWGVIFFMVFPSSINRTLPYIYMVGAISSIFLILFSWEQATQFVG
jgi:hypothetical protein